MKMINRKLKLVTLALLMGVTSLFAQSNERGIDLYRAELYEAAKLFFQNQKNQSPELQAENYYYLGQVYYALGQLADAATYYKKSQEIHPDYPFGYIGEGKLALKDGNKKEAEGLFKKAAGLVKKDPSVQTAIAEAYMDFNFAEDAEEALAKAEKINKKYPGIAVLRGNQYEKDGNMGEAGRWYENAILYDPTNKEAYLKFARGYKKLNPTLALQKLNELLQVDPEYIPAFAFIGDINYQLGNYKSAIDAYEKFISIPGVPLEQEKNYAQLLYFTDQFEKSAAQIQDILKRDPNDLVMLRLQAYNNLKLKNYDLGIQQMKSFLSKAEAKVHIYLDYITLARLYLGVKNNEEAIAALQQAEKFEGANLGEIYKEYTTAYENLKDYPKAIEYYEKFFSAENVVPVSLDYFYFGQANYSEANEILKTLDADAGAEALFKQYIDKGDKAFAEVIDRSPDAYLGYISRARINALLDSRQQKLTEKMDGLAKPYYEQAIAIMEANNADGRRNNDLIEGYNYLGSYYYVNGDERMAGEYFKKILSVNPDHQGAQSVLKSLNIKF